MNLDFEPINIKYQWLVTGCGGFIGSNLVEALLSLNQKVIGLDNFISSDKEVILAVINNLTIDQKRNFTLVEGDIRDLRLCIEVAEGCDFILHHAAISSVQKSIQDPLLNNEINVDGFNNLLTASNANQIKKFVFASSSSVYGDSKVMPCNESTHCNPLSPYAESKLSNERHASLLNNYAMKYIGLRYFNIFGRRQSAESNYSAVIPKWIQAIIRNESIYIYGEGNASRDFCYIDDVINANIKAALSEDGLQDNIFNIASGKSIHLNELFSLLINIFKKHSVVYDKNPIYLPYKRGEIIESKANISRAFTQLGIQPSRDFSSNLNETVSWFLNQQKA